MVTVRKETVVSGSSSLRDAKTDSDEREEVVSIRKTITVRIGDSSSRKYRKANERLRGSASNVKESS